MKLLQLLKNFKNRKILVIGDLVLDRYVRGNVSRISPEAPVPIVDVTEVEFTLGGAANVADNIVSLGGKATVTGVVGNDRAAETIKELFQTRGINFVAVEDRRPTTVKTRVIAHDQHVVRFDQENRQKISGRSLKSIINYIEELIPGHDAVIVSDYMKGVVTADVMRAIGRVSGKKFVAVDPKVGHFHLYKGVSLVTPNLKEASQGAGIEITDENTLLRAGAKLIRKLGCKAVLLTRGKDGMSLFQDSGLIHIPTMARKVYDVTGAGDTAIAAFVLAHAAGAVMEEAAVIANHAAGIVVEEVGTATATQARLSQSIKKSKLKLERTRYK
jgi:D-beta-D-heptose 7-phosphate kinase/D-beta-D-heptose 1-phosphate adenosyltransferase